MTIIRLHRCKQETIIKISKSIFGEKENVEFMDIDDHEPPPTLRDVSIIMREMVGQGVTWQLAEEISREFTLDPYAVDSFLSKLFREYSKLFEDEALNKEEESWSRKLIK